MEPINILVNILLSDELLQRIKAISPRIRTYDISELAGAERRGDFSRKDELNAIYAKAEVIYGLGFSHDIITRTPSLKWVQVISAGVDRFLDDMCEKVKLF